MMRIAGTIAAFVPAMLLFLGAASAAATHPTRAQQEAAFLHSVDPANTASVVTGDLMSEIGTHVAYTCDVDKVVKPGVILGQCGGEAEPMDLFVRLSTTHLHEGDRLRILGVMDRPASWSDITGHTVYYAFVQAVFVDRL